MNKCFISKILWMTNCQALKERAPSTLFSLKVKYSISNNSHNFKAKNRKDKFPSKTPSANQSEGELS